MPTYLVNFIKKYCLMVLAFSVARIFFFLFNKVQFETAGFNDFIIGIWFDSITAAILFLPLLILDLFPQSWRTKTWNFISLKIAYFLLLVPALLINFADIEYFKFTNTRSNASTFKMLSFGSDLSNQLPSFIKDYWFLLIILICLIVLLNYVYNKWVNKIKTETKLSYQLIIFLASAAILVSIGRGWGLRPISPLHASHYSNNQNTPLVLNSAFTILKSVGKQTLSEKKYFDKQNLINWFNPIKQYDNIAELSRPNIVLILLESFSVEYICSINGESACYTPFLDSLIRKSLMYKNCFANGKKSIDAVPSVISSIPKLMPEEFITSAYATNQIESIPKALKKMGYASSFYHGATNGSMNFDGFAAKVKYDYYFGKTEYNNNRDFDGTWGIYDHVFLPWSAKNMTAVDTPFFSTVFSLSSHPPYSIPDSLKNIFSGGPSQMHNAVRYSDYALRLFFEQAKKEPWYKNTLFIITADHTPSSTNKMYTNNRGIMSIPLVFFHPNNKKFIGLSNKIVGQIDIMPTLLDIVGYNETFYSFGESIFKSKNGFTCTLLGDRYLVYGYGYFMVFQHGKVIRLYNIDDKQLKSTLISDKPELVKFLKNKLLALIQTYTNGMINNNLVTEKE